MHAAASAVAAAAAAGCCVHACVRGCLRGRHHVLADLHIGEDPGCPKLARLSVSILLEYFYTKIRFSTPALSALLGLAGQIYLSEKASFA
jgi:hypothetical protein